jgi:NSS family neurotransmitter:Na+ symporter
MARERWDSRLTFILAAIGSAVGLGNAWRFPGQAFQNGGGAFLIPYFVALITAGIPLLVLEHAVGKKFQAGAPTTFKKINKKFEVLGWWALATSFVIVCYYSVVMAWMIDYIVYSFTLAWKGDTQGFFLNNVLKLTDSPGQLGGFSIPVLIGLVVAWVSIWYCIRNSVKSVGQVIKWTVILPVVFLGILMIRALTLPGAVEGISYYLTPDWSALLKPSVWAAAYGQIFFSLSVLFGIMIAYASYLPEDSDITNNALIISFADTGISFLAGFAVFGTLGYLARVSGIDIASLKYSGVFLAFVTYPEAISQLPGGAIVASIFGLVFFLMLFTLGIDSAFSIAEGIVVGLVDKFGWNRKKTLLGVCIAGFLGGLIFVTKAGLYWLDIIDHWVNDFNLVAIGVIECILVGWIFGAKKLRDYFNKDSNIKFGRWWDVMIRYITPLVLLYLSISYLIENLSKNYEDYATKYLVIGGWGVVVATLVVGIIISCFRDGTASKKSVVSNKSDMGMEG